MLVLQGIIISYKKRNKRLLTPHLGVPPFDSTPATSPIFSVLFVIELMQYGKVDVHFVAVLHLHAPVLVSQVLESVPVHDFA